MKETSWKIIDSGSASAEANMLLDEQLLKDLPAESCQPVLHLYDWTASSATYGYFTDPYTLLNASTVKDSGLQLARRPTGGGVIFHLTDFAFSILVPAGNPNYSVNILDNYAYVNHLLIEIIEQFSDKKLRCSLLQTEPKVADLHSGFFCMAKPTKYDIVTHDGRKVAGGAQRRTKNGFLHQGTISLALPDSDFLQQVLLPGTCVLEAMKQTTHSLLGSHVSFEDITNARARLRLLFCDYSL